ncbi:MAG TPA: hypothetical protein VMD02_02265 [Candidatus Omnitrophota bacterium]|nr:hypothetical protein [Candidatus Omnitrophota bacterium]
MRKILSLLLLTAFVFSLAAPSLAAPDNRAQIAKLQNEISRLEATLAKTKSNVQKARIQSTIVGHKKVIAELEKQVVVEKTVTTTRVIEKPAPAQMAPVASAPSLPKMFAFKGGLAGGAGLIAADYMMPIGPIYLGGEAGYAIGNNFGIVDAGIKGVMDFGGPFVGLEVSYGGYSKKVQDVPGLSGVIDSGVGVGLLAGTALGPLAVSVGYDTKLGARADAGYRILL